MQYIRESPEAQPGAGLIMPFGSLRLGCEYTFWASVRFAPPDHCRFFERHQ